MNKLVSVIIPCFNAERYLEEAIRSIMVQTYSNLEIIIIDDCSVDASFEILQRLSAEDERIHLYHHEQNRGLVITLNEMIVLSNGAYICRMDADDISMPKRIEKQIAFMEHHKDISICGTLAYDIDDSGKILYKSRLPISAEDNELFLPYFSTLYHPTVLVRKEFYKNHFYDINYMHAEDYELWCRAVFQDHTRICNISEYLYKYRKTSDSICSTYLPLQWKISGQIVCYYGLINKYFLDVHIDIFFSRLGNASNQSILIYIKHILKQIKGHDINAQVVVIEKMIFYLIKRRMTGEIIKMFLHPIVLYTIGLNLYRKWKERLCK